MIREECKLIIWGLGGDKEIRQGFIELFEAFSQDPAVQELPGITRVLPCYDENTNVQPGEWAPEIHLVLRKVADVSDDKSRNDNDQEGTEQSSP